MAESTQPFERKLTPETEAEKLREEIAEIPEKAKEIVEEHLRQDPERVYEPSYLIPKEQRDVIAKEIKDPSFREKREQLGELLRLVETKGILPVVDIVKNLDPSLEDEFHDLLVQYLREEKND
jgi:hypothetical protein